MKVPACVCAYKRARETKMVVYVKEREGEEREGAKERVNVFACVCAYERGREKVKEIKKCV